MSGALVVLEGPEGVGKSTQARLLAERMEVAGIDHRVLREPGGTAMGDEVRALLLHTDHAFCARAEAMLFMASRAQLVDEVVRPALASGAVVLLDRFFLSTYAYQAAGRGVDELSIRQLNLFATGGLIPSLTLLLDLPLEEGLRRARERGAPDRLERSGDDFHGRVSRAFRSFADEAWQSAHGECGPIRAIDARNEPEQVCDRIWRELCTYIPETFLAVQGSHPER